MAFGTILLFKESFSYTIPEKRGQKKGVEHSFNYLFLVILLFINRFLIKFLLLVIQKLDIPVYKCTFRHDRRLHKTRPTQMSCKLQVHDFMSFEGGSRRKKKQIVWKLPPQFHLFLFFLCGQFVYVCRSMRRRRQLLMMIMLMTIVVRRPLDMGEKHSHAP